MTDPNWKPQPGKPAMTRDGKTLVTDLAYTGTDVIYKFYSQNMPGSWSLDGGFYGDFGDTAHDLIEPTAAILAAHGIDADGRPVEPSVTPEAAEALCAARPPIFVDVHTFYDGGKALEPDAPAPSTRVDDRWFQAACAALNGLTAVSYDRQEEAPIGHVRLAAEMADALMAEVAKREGR